jgi:hypothetical protein
MFSASTHWAICSSVRSPFSIAAAPFLVPAGVADVLRLVEGAVLDHRRRALEAARQHIEAADMAMQQVGRFDRLAPHLGVEVEAALAQPTGLEDLVEGQRHLAGVVGELVGVPARLQVVAVGIDRAENAEPTGNRQFVLEGVAGEEGMADLDVDTSPPSRARRS